MFIMDMLQFVFIMHNIQLTSYVQQDRTAVWRYIHSTGRLSLANRVSGDNHKGIRHLNNLKKCVFVFTNYILLTLVLFTAFKGWFDWRLPLLTFQQRLLCIFSLLEKVVIFVIN